ncbi:MAG: OmpA family protein [Bacteroidota bacterium]|nr:OmpA family protein [Bacteroidota bacterium]
MKKKFTPLILIVLVLVSGCRSYSFLDINYSDAKTSKKIRPLNAKSNIASYELGQVLLYHHEMRNNICQIASQDTVALDKEGMGSSELRIVKSKNGKSLYTLLCFPTALTFRIPALVGLPWGHARGIVKLELDVKDNNGAVIKTYKAKGSHSSFMACYWGYKTRDDAKDKSKDKAFAKAMTKIKNQMDADADFLNSKLPPGMLSEAEQKANKFIADGNKRFDAKDYASSIQNYETALSMLDPLKKQHAKFVSQLGLSYQKNSSDSASIVASIKYLKKSMELDPKLDFMVPVSLYVAYESIQDFTNAKKSLDNVLDNFSLNQKQKDLINEWKSILVRDEAQITAGTYLKDKPEKVTINNLGPEINGKEGDYFPSVTADESMLLFTSRRAGSTGGLNSEGEYDEDLWYCLKKTDGTWDTPKNFGSPVNIANNNGIASFTGDGQYVVCARCNESDGVGSCDLYGTTLTGNTWGTPKNLGSVINSKEWDAQVSISADGKTLVWSSSRPGGLGEEDLWISRKNDKDEWTTPKNLGSMVNTSGNEYSPFLHPDGKTLYFSSNNLAPRLGGFDIFKTTINADGSCTKPENVGYPINTTKNDLYFVLTPSGLKGYFASDRAGGQGKNDLYEIIYPQEKKSSLTTFIGNVMDDETKIPLEANIRIEDLDSAKLVGEYVSNSATGKCVVILTPGHNYSLTVSKNGYLFYSENFNIPADHEFTEVKKDIPLQAIKEGKKIVLNNIFFQTGKAELTETSIVEIENLYNLLVQNPEIKVEISGHTDNVGNKADNTRLSQERAAVVVKALVTKGTVAARLTAKGYGDSMPVAPNDTDENKQLNRRTEFKIISATK